MLKRREWRKSKTAKARLKFVDGLLWAVAACFLFTMFAVQIALSFPSAREVLSWVDRTEGEPVAPQPYGLKRLLSARRYSVTLAVPGGQQDNLGVFVNGKELVRLEPGQKTTIAVRELDLIAVEPPGHVMVVATSPSVVSPVVGQIITSAGFRVRIRK
ncbi:MAG TPA: hypothetical protein GXX40_00855 [Firmicutes bacterium]|nr:hypothetical protein [Bacillota bacterium]